MFAEESMEEDEDVEALIDQVRELVDHVDKEIDTIIEEDQDAECERNLRSQCKIQKRLVDVGERVGQSGNSGHVLQDAMLAHRANNQSTR